MNPAENSSFINSPNVQTVPFFYIKKAGKMLLLLIAMVLCRMASRHYIHIPFFKSFFWLKLLSVLVLSSFPSYRKSGWRGSGRHCWVLWVEATGGRRRREMMPDPEHQSSFQQPVSVDTHRDATHSASLPGHCSKRIHAQFHFTLIFIFCTNTHTHTKVKWGFPTCCINT